MKFSLQKLLRRGRGALVQGSRGERIYIKTFPCPSAPLPLCPFTLSLVRSILVSLLVLSPVPALADGARTVYSQDAQGINSVGVELKVWRGYGLTINFIPTGEVIKQVWIGDPSRISFTSNGSLCQKTRNSSNNDSTDNCGNDGATVIFLRQIKPISFPNMTTSSDGSTQITIITSGSDGQKQYQFKLIPATGQPNYTSLVIKPDSERPLPIVRTKPQIVPTATFNQTPVSITTPTPSPRSAAFHQTVPNTLTTKTPTQSTTPTSTPSPLSTEIAPSRNSSLRNDANAVAYGLAIAHRNGQVKEGSTTWNKAQDAIKLLRRGKSRHEAIKRSGIDVKVFNQLIEWGQR